VEFQKRQVQSLVFFSLPSKVPADLPKLTLHTLIHTSTFESLLQYLDLN
jgi:hypothetical protein